MVILEFAEEFIYVRFVSTEPGMSVDGGVFVYPGQTFIGWSYEELRALGPGGHNIPKRRKRKPSHDAQD